MGRFVVTEKIERRVLEVYGRTKSTQKTAKQIGVGVSTAHRILKRHGVKCEGLKLYRDRIRKLPPSDALREEYEGGLYLTEIAKKYGVCVQTAQEAVKKSGAQMNRRGQQRRVYSQDEMDRMADLYKKGWSQTAIANDLNTHQTSVSRMLRRMGLYDGVRASGPDHGSWKGGRVQSSGGYIACLIDKNSPFSSMRPTNGYVLEHRLVMAEHLGRPLRADESVHHINGDKKDNRIENLQLRQGQHGKHAKHQCVDCGSLNVVGVKL